MRRRVADQGVRQLLVVDELAALERIGQVLVQRIRRIEDGVVATLDHPRAAALADQPLGRQDDAQARIRPRRVQRREQARAPPEPRISTSQAMSSPDTRLTRASARYGDPAPRPGD